MDANAGREMAASLRVAGCTTGVHTVAYAGHALNIDEPEQFAELVVKLAQ